MSDYRSALKYFEEELTIDRRFVARAPNNLTALTDLQWTLNKLTDFVRQRLGDRAAARKYIEEMIGIDRRLIEREPNKQGSTPPAQGRPDQARQPAPGN